MDLFCVTFALLFERISRLKIAAESREHKPDAHTLACREKPCYMGLTLSQPALTLFPEDTPVNLDDTLSLAARGYFLTRPGLGETFFALRDGKLLRGHFIGETNITEMKACVFSEEDRQATDWKIFHRVLPDAWEGCDAPVKNTQT